MIEHRPSLVAALLLVVGATGVGVVGTPAHAACAPGSRAEVVVKVDLAAGHTIQAVVAARRVEPARSMLASHGLFVLRSTDPADCGDHVWSTRLADEIEDYRGVVYAEPNLQPDLSDGRFHAWPAGDPIDAGTDPAVWTGQPAIRQLRLAEAHVRSRGAGASVAVFDTGADLDHPALAGRLLPGWDYVDDDADPREVADGVDDDADGAVDESFGHGTFVGGVVALVAPDARILPYRVLDSDGRGNLFVLAEAIPDAVRAGADVINLSLGSSGKPTAPLLEEAIKAARKAGVVVVAAAGNEATTAEQYPAALSEVTAVSALGADGRRLAPFSNSGGWVDVAAPGTLVAGPVPGGRYAWWNGTSVAAPFVAGQAALIAAASPTLDAVKIVDAVTTTATVVKLLNQADVRAIDVPRSVLTLR